MGHAGMPHSYALSRGYTGRRAFARGNHFHHRNRFGPFVGYGYDYPYWDDYGYGGGSCYWNCRNSGYGPGYCNAYAYNFCY
jgi:hypothetical protein